MSKIVYLIQSLQTSERLNYINKNLQTFPDLQIFKSINGYDINETTNELLNSNIMYHTLEKEFVTYGTLANFLTKVNAFKYQVKNNIEYMCLIEDDLILNDNFKDFIEKLLPLLKDCNMLRLSKWGEGYVTSLEGAKKILNHIYEKGIINNIDNQLRLYCGKEIHINNTPFYLCVDTNCGDCLKTKYISDEEIVKFKSIKPLTFPTF